MVARIEEYLSGQGSLRGIAEANGIGYSTFYGWVKKYQEHGASAIVEKNGCSSYSKEFKVRCVEAVIGGEGSVNDIVIGNHLIQQCVPDRFFALKMLINPGLHKSERCAKFTDICSCIAVLWKHLQRSSQNSFLCVVRHNNLHTQQSDLSFTHYSERKVTCQVL